MRKLRVFLCHATEDKPAVRKLYTSLKAESWIDPWLDEENLLPGQDWDLEIYKATRDADAIIICLSTVSVKKEGYVNKEIRHALDIAQEKPEGAIYVIPLRLDDCKPSFERLKKLHWADYFTPNAHERLLKSLRLRAHALKISVPETEISSSNDEYGLYRFIKIEPHKNSKVNYPFWIGTYTVTNAQYERFVKAPDFANPVYWLEFPKFDKKCMPIGNWGTAGFDWLKAKLKKEKSEYFYPRIWDDSDFGKSKVNNPVVQISWYEASAYCEWLFQNWESLAESKANPGFRPQIIRLPMENEWETAAGGDEPNIRFPWDEEGKATISAKEILLRSNLHESGIAETTPVHKYPLGKSPLGVMDMVGNVWEWQANLHDEEHDWLSLRGGSWREKLADINVTARDFSRPSIGWRNYIGFRVVCFPK